ncbi:MAG: hypothetical protein ABR613_12685 [Actinomycetota bacterium]
MNEIERGLRELGEEAGRESAGDLRPRPGSLGRVRLRRRLLSGSVALCTALVVAGGVVLAGDGGPRRDPAPARQEDEPSPQPDQRAERCGVPFEPTYLPPGFEAGPKEGAGGDAPDVVGTVAHFGGSTGRFIEVTVPFRGGFAETRRAAVTVLGRRGVLGAIHEGYAVEFRVGRCRYELLGYGVTRRQLRDFAEGLVATEPRASAYFAAVWPEDTAAGARRGCRRGDRSDPVGVASDFTAQVMRWLDPDVAIVARSPSERTLDVRPADGVGREPPIRRGVRLHMREVLPDCWSVASASPPDERAVLGISVRGEKVDVSFDRGTGVGATVEIGYGRSKVRKVWDARARGLLHLDIGFEPETTGHFLILLHDADGTTFTALGRPLPPGDFAAG